MLELEFTEHLNAGRYKRKEERKGYRNGYSTWELYTRVWGLTLRVPRDREGAFSTQLFERYQRSEKALVLALQESYLQGVSTRKVKKITEKLCGVSFSKDQVSRMAQALDAELGAWRAGQVYTKINLKMQERIKQQMIYFISLINIQQIYNLFQEMFNLKEKFMISNCKGIISHYIHVED